MNMKNSDQPITPAMIKQTGDSAFRVAKEKEVREDNYITTCTGLTKREYFAGLAMQGLLVNFVHHGMYGNQTNYPMVSEMAVIQADELLKQLES